MDIVPGKGNGICVDVDDVTRRLWGRLSVKIGYGMFFLWHRIS